MKPTLASAGIDKPCESLSDMLRRRECCDDGTPLPARLVRRGTRSEAGSAVLHVRDANGQPLAYVYFEEEPGRRSAARLLTRDGARRITKLPALLKC